MMALVYTATLAALCIIWWLFAVAEAREEVALTWPFRNMVWQTDNKKDLQRQFHRAGAQSVGWVLLGTGLLYGQTVILTGHPWWLGTVLGLICIAACGLVYWWRFDMAYARGINQGKYYLGDTADMDNWLRRLGTRHVGRKKAYLCAAVVVLLHAAVFTIFVF